MKITQLIDGIDRNINRIKTLAVLFLLALFIISVSINGCNRKQAESMVEKITGLNVQNDILLNSVKSRDSLILAKEDSITVLKAEIVKSKNSGIALSKKYSHLKAKFDAISDSLIKIPIEDSYSFLDTVAYPYGGKKTFPFSEPQVKGMHKTYMERESLTALNVNLLGQNIEMGRQIKLFESLQAESDGTIKMMKENRKDLDSVIENKDDISEAEKKNAKKKKRKEFITKAGFISGAFIVGFLVGR